MGTRSIHAAAGCFLGRLRLASILKPLRVPREVVCEPVTKTNADDRALAVMATRGMEDFLENSLHSAARCGFDMRHVHVFHSQEVAPTVDRLAERFGLTAHEFKLGEVAGRTMGYRPYGTREFRELMRQKTDIFKCLFADYNVVMYSNVDVVWMRNPWSYLDGVMTKFDIAIQTEAVATFPPTYCMGLVVAKDTQWSRAKLEQLQRTLSETIASDEKASDQSTFNAMIAKEPDACSRIFSLPEGLFPNGLLTSQLTYPHPEAGIMAGVLEPIAYHANWTIGTDNKRRLLSRAGLWNPGGEAR